MCVVIVTSEVGLAVQVSTHPSAFCSSERKVQSLVSMVPLVTLPAHEEQEPARHA